MLTKPLPEIVMDTVPETAAERLRRIEAKLDLFAGLLALAGGVLEDLDQSHTHTARSAVDVFLADYVKVSAR